MDPLDDEAAMLDDLAMSNHHDSQMITQEISDDEGEDNTQGTRQFTCIMTMSNPKIQGCICTVIVSRENVSSWMHGLFWAPLHDYLESNQK